MRRVSRASLLTLGLLMALIAMVLTCANVILFPYAQQIHGYSKPGVLLALAATLAAYAYLDGRMASWDDGRLLRMQRVLLAVFLLAHLALGYLMEYTPMGDNHMLYDGSAVFAKLGNFGGDDYDLYLSRFSNQWGFFLILVAFNKLLLFLGIANRFYALVVVQAALYALALRVLLSLAREMGGSRTWGRLMVLLFLCLPLYLAAAVLYTDTFSAPFVIFTFYFAMKAQRANSAKQALGYAALCGVMAFTGGQIKMTAAIVVIASVIVWLLTMKPARAAAASLVAALILIGGTKGMQGIMTAAVLDPAMVAQHHTPTIHWVMMSIPSSDNPNGGPSSDYAITWGMQEEGATKEEVMASILSRMKDKIYFLRYPNRLLPALMRKNAASQGDGTFGMTEMLDDGPVRWNVISEFVLGGGRQHRLYMSVTTGIWYAVLVLSALRMYADIKEKNTSRGILIIALFGMQLFMMLWEARSRYIFSFLPLMLLLCACCAREDINTLWKGRTLCKTAKSAQKA